MASTSALSGEFLGRRRGGSSNADLTKVLDFTLASVRLLTEQSLVIVNGIIDQAETQLGGRPAASHGATQPHHGDPAHAEIVLQGARGSTASAAFMLENKFDRPLELHFEMSDLSSDAGPAISGAIMAIEPEHVTVPPHGQKIIRLSLTIGEMFLPGARYFASLLTAGFEARRIGVRLDVEGDLPGRAE
jgi:hypothetical protein